MANSLNTNLENKVIVLREEQRKPEYQAIGWRVCYVKGGFGSASSTSGTALIVRDLADDESYRTNGYAVERLATREDVEAANAIRAEQGLDPFQVTEQMLSEDAE